MKKIKDFLCESGPFFYYVALENREAYDDGVPFTEFGNECELDEDDCCYKTITDKTLPRIISDIQNSIKSGKYPKKLQDDYLDDESVKYISLMIGTDSKDTSEWLTYVSFDSETGEMRSSLLQG